MKTKEADFPAAQENWRQKKAVYENELAEFRQQLNDKSADRSII